MDFSRNAVLKENYTFLVADAEAGVTGAEHGLYNRDTRFLSRYRWHTAPELQPLLSHSSRPDMLYSHLGLLDHHHQRLAVRRELQLTSTELLDRLTVDAYGPGHHDLVLELDYDADFADLFEVRGWGQTRRTVTHERSADSVRMAYRSSDRLDFATLLRFSQTPAAHEPGRARFDVSLGPGQTWVIEMRASIFTPLEDALPGIGYDEWRRRFSGLAMPACHEEVVRRAVDDLRALLLFTSEGPVPAAGIPWFVAAFGRDALLASAMLLPLAPDVAEGTLRYLGRHQGRLRDGFRAELPGKVMHELRFGELARTGSVPHSPYFGTVDATPLFIVLLERLWRATGNLQLVRELKPHWEAALEWLLGDGDPDGDGFLEFTAAEPGQGLTVQSWKDSPESMSHGDGTLARGALAACEVQGYAFDAYRAAAAFYRALGDEATAKRWDESAQRLRSLFHDAFWDERLGTYAMALDGDRRPLRVHSSGAGQLLWSGIVPETHAARLRDTLFAADNWSGWGFRTLGANEARYNPVSYHNGSVWPHDTALIAAGLHRYGFVDDARRVARALLDLAATQPDRRLPELVAGYPRSAGDRHPEPNALPPVPYPVACRPQAWDAAALLLALGLA